ncbi:MAG TPA: FIST N-terminal domain-containing protein [Rhodocyclaceae bacterium]
MTLQTVQVHLTSLADAASALEPLQAIDPQLLLVFGAAPFFSNGALTSLLFERLPQALPIGCSTAGEISAAGVADGRCVITALRFDHTATRAAHAELARMDGSRQAGEALARQLAAADLRAVMVFGPGVDINGSALIDGLVAGIGADVPITGGLAGDGGAFKQTWTLGGEGVSDRGVVAVGFYGAALEFGHGSFGGWAPFGPARKVTRCQDNILYELDGAPALDIYKQYLGEYARDLPASGLLFPFSMLGEDRAAVGLIRTILGIDEAAGSLILAGDIDPNGYLKLMHASTDGLLDGSHAAAEAALKMMRHPQQGLAVLVSCVGRKLAMGGRVDEEVEAVAKVYGEHTPLAGFYSYGEISPFTPGLECKLHNQTMTITYLAEAG